MLYLTSQARPVKHQSLLPNDLKRDSITPGVFSASVETTTKEPPMSRLQTRSAQANSVAIPKLDRATGQIACVSLDRNRTWMEESGAPAIDASGAVVAFSSRHPISAGDVANDFDLFVRLLAQ